MNTIKKFLLSLPIYLSDRPQRSFLPGEICFQRPSLCALYFQAAFTSAAEAGVSSAIRASGRARRLLLGGTCPSTTPSLSPSTRSVSLLLAHNDSLVLFSSFVTACSIPERWRRGPQVLTSRRVPHLQTVIATMRNQITRTTRAEIRVIGAVTQISPPTEVSTRNVHTLAAPREMPMTVRVQLDQHYL